MGDGQEESLKKILVDLESLKRDQDDSNKKSNRWEERWTNLDNRCEENRGRRQSEGAGNKR